MNLPVKKLALALAATTIMWAKSSQGQFNNTISLFTSGTGPFNQMDAYLRSGAGVTFETPGFFNFASPEGGWTSTFWSPTIVSASGPPFLGYVALSIEGPGTASFSVDFYEWNGETLNSSYNITFINGFPYDYPASVTESGPVIAPEPSFLPFVGVFAITLAAMRSNPKR